MTTATDNMIPVPGGAVLRNLRTGLIYQLGLASDEIGAATDMANAELHLIGPLQRFDYVRPLLEELADRDSDECMKVSAEHLPLIAEALSAEAHTLADMARSSRKDGDAETATRRRAERAALIDFLSTVGAAGGGA